MDDQQGSDEHSRALTQDAWRSPRRQLLVLLGLTGFAISQPMLSILGENPTFLTFHGVEGTQVLLFALVVALVPPLVLWTLTMVGRRVDQRVGDVAHLLLVAALAAAAVNPLLKELGIPRALVVLPLGLAIAAGITWLYARRPGVAMWASYTAVLPVMAVLSFTFFSPAADLRQSAEAPDRVDTDAPSVVFIVLDELPTRSLLDADGGLDAARYPNLAAFAGDATWYRHHTALSSRTEVAVPSLLTGKVPSTDEPLWTNHPDNLFTLLAPTHELEAIEVATNLCPYDACAPTVDGQAVTSGPGFGDLLDATRELWAERASPRPAGPSLLDDFEETPVDVTTDGAASEAPLVTESVPVEDREPGFVAFEPSDESMIATSQSVEAMTSAFDASKGSTLYYLHLLRPHQPWRFFPDGSLYSDTDPLGETLDPEVRQNLFSWSEWDAAVNEERHLLQMEYTDQLVGQLLQGLRDSGLYDSSLIVLTSDHGFNFEHDTEARLVTPETVDSLSYVPLLIKEPGQEEGRTDDGNVWSTDVLPTIAELLGVELPAPVDGTTIGSAAMEARGTDKVQYDMRGLGVVTDHGIVEFDDATTFPLVAAQRWIDPSTPPGDPAAALTPLLGVGDRIGRPFASLEASPGGSIDLLAEDELRRVSDDRAPIGISVGVTEDPPAGSEAVLAIDGTIVAGSRLSEIGPGRYRVTFFIPQGTLDDDNDVAVALVLPDGSARELSVT